MFSYRDALEDLVKQNKSTLVLWILQLAKQKAQATAYNEEMVRMAKQASANLIAQ